MAMKIAQPLQAAAFTQPHAQPVATHICLSVVCYSIFVTTALRWKILSR